MMDLYNSTCFECSKLITHKYSTSFSLGIRAFAKAYRLPIYSIYGFVRYADEIVDSFHGHDKQKLINDFKADTYKAIQEKISLNPVLHSFQSTVNRYHIPLTLIDAFLKSMEMDLDKNRYEQNQYEEYIYGSAEVIGLMCLLVFCDGDQKRFNELTPTARSLGSAFQKINFLRDIKSDYEERGRVYFPNVQFEHFNDEAKKLIEEDIQLDFEHAFSGIKNLPSGSRLGVYIAYTYYLELFKKIKQVSAEAIANQRIRVSDSKKAYLFIEAMIKNKFLAA